MPTYTYSEIKDPLSSLKVYTIAKLCFGYYHLFTSSRVVDAFIKLYCINCPLVLTVIMGIIGLMQNRESANFWLLEYILLVLLSVWDKNEYLTRYCKYMYVIDKTLGICKGSVWNAITLSPFLCSMIVRIPGITLIFLYSLYSLIPIALINVAIELYNINLVIIFNMLWLRVKHLRLEAAKLQSLDVTSDEKIRKIKKIMAIFKHLFDNLNKDTKLLKFQVLICIILGFIRSTFNLDTGIGVAFSELPVGLRIVSLTTTSLEEVRIILALAFPVLAAELVLYETDQLKLALVDCLLNDDGSCRPYLLETLELVEEQPLQLVVCGFRLDAKLLFSFLSLCSTYIFVILQFRYT